jgi:hypothetical protein
MIRKGLPFVLSLATLLATMNPCLAQFGLPQVSRPAFAAPARPAAGGGLLARLNRPLVPTLPGTPTASPLGPEAELTGRFDALVSPRECSRQAGSVRRRKLTKLP